MSDWMSWNAKMQCINSEIVSEHYTWPSCHFRSPASSVCSTAFLGLSQRKQQNCITGSLVHLTCGFLSQKASNAECVSISWLHHKRITANLVAMTIAFSMITSIYPWMDGSDGFNDDKVKFPLTHWGRVTHICVSKLTVIGSNDGLSPGRRKPLSEPMLIGPLGTNFSEILNWNLYIVIQENAFENVIWKLAAILSRPHCLQCNDE